MTEPKKPMELLQCCSKCAMFNKDTGEYVTCAKKFCECHVPVGEPPTPDAPTGNYFQYRADPSEKKLEFDAPPTEWEERLEKQFFDRDKMLRYLEGASMKDFIRTLLAEQKARMVEEIKQELERLRQVRILIPKNVGGNSKCITEGYHRCLDKVDKFIKALSK